MNPEARKRLLRRRIAKQKAELHAIERQERDNRNKALVGLYFKMRAHYPHPETNRDYWWIHLHALRAEADGLHCFRFEMDCYGYIRVAPDTVTNADALVTTFEFSTQADFRDAWRECTKRITGDRWSSPMEGGAVLFPAPDRLANACVTDRVTQ
ncbi:MAG TPA: hypothetical protein VFM97_00515 [Gammaproteobacteria bacterium]|nr:hypothetical protein [Gammaproteobacteria bacterium]